MDEKELLAAGSEEEVQLRGCTIEAVEMVKQRMEEVHGGSGQQLPHTIQLDWWLWELGEAMQQQHRPHHRTLTHFY